MGSNARVGSSPILSTNKPLSMNRIEANLKLLEILRETLCKNPELRFIQALWSLKIIDSKVEEGAGHEIIVPVDRFYEEPSETLKRIGYGE